MRKSVQKPIYYCGLVLMLLATIIFGFKCSQTKPKPNPLEGWKHYFNAHLDKAIIDDYQGYIQELPAEERNVVDDYSVEPLENEEGGHAVKIEIPLKGTFWEHILIYDQNNRRIKTIKYQGGQYRS